MNPVVIDGVFGGIIVLIGITMLNEGAWGAGLMLFNAVFAALIAINFYEPLAKLVIENAPLDMIIPFADVLTLGGLFAVSLLVLRLYTDAVGYRMVRLPKLVQQIGGGVFGLGAAAVVVGMILILFQTSPVHKDLFTVSGVGKPGSAVPFGLALDRKLLGYVETASQTTFSNPAPTPFDADAWIATHAEYRPYETGAAAPAAAE